MTFSDNDVAANVTSHATRVPQVLGACLAMLVSQASVQYTSQVEDVFIRLARSAGTDVPLKLLLSNAATDPAVDSQVPQLIRHKLGRFVSPSTVELIYQLGTSREPQTIQR